MWRICIGLATIALVACGGDEESEQGFTECGENTCQPGQYCEDADFGTCRAGCTSDTNCAANQSCQDPDFFNIGVCRNVGAVCGNGACEAGETSANCAADCGSGVVCGNQVCEPGETAASCPADCSTCGNAICDPGETPANCPADCVTLTDACKEECFDYDFFSCMAPGELQTCYNKCEAATDTQITQYLNCNGSVFCDSSCFTYLP